MIMRDLNRMKVIVFFGGFVFFSAPLSLSHD